MPSLSPAAPSIQWYPGHIAQAEKSLSANLEKVDLVLEVRDARIPLATGHPRLERWMRGKPRLLVLNRRDMISEAARLAWDHQFRAAGRTPWWCDAKVGTGVKQLQQAAIRAGVTRSLRWVRLGQVLDLLDAPGVLPPRLDDQEAALHLALCDDLGQAAYDGEAVALALIQRLASLEAVPAAAVAAGLLEGRYGPSLAPLGASAVLAPAGVAAVDAGGVAVDAETWLATAAARHTSGDTGRMAQRLLDDFRRGVLGPIALELPPPTPPTPLTPAAAD